MATGKKNILVYADWIDKFEELTDDEAGKLIKHFFRYVNDLNPEYPDRTTKLMFIDIKATLKRDLGKWEDSSPQRIEKARLAGLASAEARRLKKKLDSTNELHLVEFPTKSTVSVSVSVNDNVKEVISIYDRKLKFSTTLIPFLDLYDKDLIRAFCDYWTEHGENDKKMRFEKEKSFGLGRRLATWNKNNFGNNTNNKKQTQYDLTRLTNELRAT
jgi:hypothetical protein